VSFYLRGGEKINPQKGRSVQLFSFTPKAARGGKEEGSYYTLENVGKNKETEQPGALIRKRREQNEMKDPVVSANEERKETKAKL